MKISKKNKMIRVISPYNKNLFNVELKGNESSLKDLLSTILNIPSTSIKGIRDNYNNYYTLSSALNSSNINKIPNNYFSIIINNNDNNNINNITQNDMIHYTMNKNSNYMTPSLYNNMYLNTNHYINNSDIYYNNIKINNIHNYESLNRNIGQYSNFFKKYSKEAYYNLIIFLYKTKLIGKNNYYKLKKCIKANNNDVIEILKPFIEFDKDYKKLINNLFPILNLDLSINGSSYLKINSIDKNNQNINLLNSIKNYFTKENLEKLNYLLLIENMSIIKVFESYYKTRNKENLVDELYSLLKKVSKIDLDKSNNIIGNIIKKRKSKSYNYKKAIEGNNKSKNKYGNKKYNAQLLQKITDKIIKYGKKFSKDIYYLMKYELNTISSEEKENLFINKFDININKSSFKELSEKSKKNIKHYYKKYINKNIYEFLEEEEKDIYENIISTQNSQEYDDIIKIYSELIEDDKIKNKMELLRNKIINYLKDLKKVIEEKSEISKTSENEPETNKEKSASKKLIFHDDEEEEEEEDEESNKEEKESSTETKTENKEEEKESENYDNADEESGVSIKKADRNKRNN